MLLGINSFVRMDMFKCMQDKMGARLCNFLIQHLVYNSCKLHDLPHNLPILSSYNISFLYKESLYRMTFTLLFDGMG